VVSVTPRPLFTHCTGGCVGLGAGLDRCGKPRPTGIRSPDRPARSQSLYRLHYPAHPWYETGWKSIASPDALDKRNIFLPLVGTESRFWSFNPQSSVVGTELNRLYALRKCVLMPELNASVLKKTLCVLTSIALNTALVELASGRLFCRSLMTLTPCAFTCSGLRKAFSMFLCHSRVERGTITFLT